MTNPVARHPPRAAIVRLVITFSYGENLRQSLEIGVERRRLTRRRARIHQFGLPAAVTRRSGFGYAARGVRQLQRLRRRRRVELAAAARRHWTDDRGIECETSRRDAARCVS